MLSSQNKKGIDCNCTELYLDPSQSTTFNFSLLSANGTEEIDSFYFYRVSILRIINGCYQWY